MTMNRNICKPTLSKGILDMKFMKRTKEKVDKEAESAEGRAMYSHEITGKMLYSHTNFVTEPSFVVCENLIDGRLSFRGMNPEIEQILQQEKTENEMNKKHEQAMEVSNDEMGKLYHTEMSGALNRIIAKKFKKRLDNKSKMYKLAKNTVEVKSSSKTH